MCERNLGQAETVFILILPIFPQVGSAWSGVLEREWRVLLTAWLGHPHSSFQTVRTSRVLSFSEIKQIFTTNFSESLNTI